MPDLSTLNGLADLSFTILVLGGIFLYRIWGVGDLIQAKTEELEHRNRRLRSEDKTAESANANERNQTN